MDLFMNFGLAWISVFLGILLAIIYVTKRFCQPVNSAFRKYHKEAGIALIGTGVLHGAFSSQAVASLNLGTACWVCSVLLGLNWFFRRSFARIRGWIYYHRILTAAFVLTLALHIASVGIHAPQIIAGVSSPPRAKVQISAAQLASGERTVQGVVLKDGTFEGEATGYRPGLKVQVDVANNMITGIEITEHNEVNSSIYLKPMDLIPAQIISSQSLAVDTVTGATRTSVGIVNAVRDALSNSVASGNLPTVAAQPVQTAGAGGGRGRAARTR